MIDTRIQAAILLAVFILIMTVEPAVADSYHHHSTQVTVVEKTSHVSPMGLAAAEKHLYWGTLKTQWAIGAANVDDNTAISFGIGKRQGDVLYSGSISIEEGSTGIGFGASGRF